MIFYYISFPSFGSIEEMDMIETAIIYIKRNKIFDYHTDYRDNNPG